MKNSITKQIKSKKLGVFFSDDLSQALKDPKFQEAWNQGTGDVYLDAAFELIKARTDSNLSQRELAEKIGTSQQAIARLENPTYKGRSLTTLQKVATALGRKVEIRLV